VIVSSISSYTHWSDSIRFVFLYPLSFCHARVGKYDTTYMMSYSTIQVLYKCSDRARDQMEYNSLANNMK
jgi:hypothetical protein